jgi:hypothetical protein
MADDLVQLFLQKYPQAAWMFQDPELRYLIVANMDPNTGFDSGRFQQQLQSTNWYRTHSDTMRQWTQMAISDPATAEAAIQSKMRSLGAIAQSAGLTLNPDQLRWEATLANQQGWDDIQARQNLLQVGIDANKGDRTATGQSGGIGSINQQVRALSAQYLLPITDGAAAWYAQDIWQGKMNLDDLKGQFAHAATFTWGGSNPALVAAMNNGTTPRQFLDPQIQAVASTLEMSADQIDPLNPTYSPLLNYTDKSGTTRMMTVPESQVWARGQSPFQNTVQGRQASSDFVTSLAKDFGKTA